MATSRAGARRGKPTRPTLSPRTVLLAVAAFVALLGWAALVWTAIGFGRSARGGEEHAWWWLALASAAAVVCLCGCLLLATATLRGAGILEPRGPRRH